MGKRWEPSELAAQLNDLVWRSYEAPHETAAALERLGAQDVRVSESGVIYLIGRSGIMTAVAGDPITRAVCLGFALYGVFWPWAVPDLLKTVNREWTARRKAGRPEGAIVG